MTYHPRTVAHSNSGIKLLSMVMFALNPLSVFRYFQGYLLEETKNEKATEYHARTSSSSTNPAATGAGVKKTESTEQKRQKRAGARSCWMVGWGQRSAACRFAGRAQEAFLMESAGALEEIGEEEDTATEG